MRLRTKAYLLIGFIGLLMVTVSAVGWYALATLDRALHDVAEHQIPTLVEHKINPLINEQVGALISQDLPEVAGRYESITLMLNADRDMYQALVAEREALAASTPEAWEKAKQASEENLGQAEERRHRAGECGQRQRDRRSQQHSPANRIDLRAGPRRLRSLVCLYAGAGNPGAAVAAPL